MFRLVLHKPGDDQPVQDHKAGTMTVLARPQEFVHDEAGVQKAARRLLDQAANPDAYVEVFQTMEAFTCTIAQKGNMLAPAREKHPCSAHAQYRQGCIGCAKASGEVHASQA